MKNSYFLLVGMLLVQSCFSQNSLDSASTETEISPWYFRAHNDSLSGISLAKLPIEKLKATHLKKPLVIAIIDTEIDQYHEELDYSIWNNEKEIPNNMIDDDQNGYIDDVHGWNFIGNQSGKNIIFSNFEFVRILRKCNIGQSDSVSCKQAKDAYDAMASNYKKRIQKFQKHINYFDKADSTLTRFFANSDYGIEDLKNIKTKDSAINIYAKKLFKFYKKGYTREKLINNVKEYKDFLNISLNLEHIDRQILQENSDSLSDINYGNNKMSMHLEEFYHATLVSGIIAAKKDNNKGIVGITNEVRIMPLAISSNGDEHDKDIALAIRYAVNNGAKIINMSSGKLFSLHPDWVLDAIKYAESKDVLFVTSAGNNNLDLDLPKNSYYPFYNDVGKETNNFIMVGGSSKKISKLKSKNSSYGKNSVDVFAPGENILSTLPHNEYKVVRGTSFATPIVSGVAALIMSHYPELSASQVKQILMESSTKYEVEVELEQEDGSKKLVPFSALSKSGGVVNAYSALVMAENLSKRKKSTH